MPNFAEGISLAALWDAWRAASPLAQDVQFLLAALVLVGGLVFVRKLTLLLWRGYTDSRFAEKFFSHPDLQQANDNLRMEPTPASRVFVAGLIEWNFWKKRGGDEPPMLNLRWQNVSHAMRFQVDVEVAEMRRWLALVSIGCWLAPLLGVVGTAGDAIALLAAGNAAAADWAGALVSLFAGALAGSAFLVAHAILVRSVERFDERLTVALERFVSWAYR
ncbi:MAG: MotA/TolQ/ExbB proton channel family protein [Hyphomicrobiales bacterium]|nr:MotA/TolQ/ExbB proton channel family protein [Hyphomicrobiales bacterium]